MSRPRPSSVTLLLFAIAGALGPVLHMVRPEARETAGGADRFVADLVALLWPAQPIAVIEVSTGPIVAFAVAASVNVGLFSVVGWIACGLAAHRKSLFVFFAVVSGGATLLELLWAGFDWHYVRHLALVAALALQAALFLAASRLRDGARHEGSR